MINALYKSKQFLVVLLKLSVVVSAFCFIYYKLIYNDALAFYDFYGYSTENAIFSIKNVIFLLFLTILNWFFEILKWKTLVSATQSISFKNALEQSLGALTASLVTPNRIGEYGVKAMYYEKSYRKKIMLLNLLGNMLQMTTTVVFGIIGLFFFMSNFQLELNYFNLFIIAFTLLLILGVFLFSQKKKRFQIKGFSLQKIFRFIKNISVKIKIRAFLFSLLRYLIFLFQFFYLLLIYGVQIHYFEAMMLITTMYFLSSVIPSIFIFDVVIKGSVAIFLFSFVGVNDLTVLCVVTLMWLLNFVLPSVIGSYYVIQFTLPKELETI